MLTFNLKSLRTAAFHIVFWIAVWFLYFYFFNYNSSDKAYVIWFSSLLMPVTIAVTYVFSYFLIPKYLVEKKYGKFILGIVYSLIISSYLIVIIIYGCLIFLKKWDATNIPPMLKNFVFILLLVYLVAGIVGFVTIIRLNFKTVQQNKELQNKILNTQLKIKDQELNYLKRQLHPHFLFNTLNTIYGFALQNSKQTPEIILKLSNLLDYILYQVDKPMVALEDEVMHIKEYIALERTRFRETLRTSFESVGIDPAVQVPPMLLLPFVENAFKHGTIVEEELRIDIRIELSENRLNFQIGNSVADTVSKPGNGIGLENARRRLDMHYADRYTLDQQTEEKWYKVELIVDPLIHEQEQ